MNSDLRKLLKKYNIQLSESTVSMILGAVVVIVVGILAYNYFRLNRQPVVTPAEVSTTAPEPQSNPTTGGDLTAPQSAVALPTTHIVAEGEDLWTISEKYFGSGFNFVDIASVNELVNPNYLQVGQKLTIPKVEVRVPLVMTAPLYPTVTDSQISGNSYVVQKGDNLWMIAVRAYGDGFKWTEIAKSNNLANPRLIFSGNVLSIPR